MGKDSSILIKFGNLLYSLCQDKYSHWRTGQLLSNFISWLESEKCLDIFYVEDQELLDLLKEFSKEGNI